MQMQQRDSGILVPEEKPQPPLRTHAGALELQNGDQRAKAVAAFSELWDAMDLSSGRASLEVYEAHYQAYEYVGKMLLGDDLPQKEILT